MGYLESRNGIQPAVREELELRDKASSGDIVLVITPTAVDLVTTSAAWTRNVKLSVQSAAGEVHKWLNQAYTTTLSIADTSSAGTASIVATTLTLVDGEATIVVSGDAVLWDTAETDTLTVANITVLGYTVTGGTSVQTIVAS
jgi:hypothetical protein